jgi:hypothetical protein
MVVAEHVNLDMSRALEIALEDERRVAEGGRGFASRRRDGGREIARALDEADTFAPSAGARLDEQRVADLVGFARERHVVLRRP